MRVLTWDSLTWEISKRNPNLSRCEVVLMAGELLRVEEGWEISGPVRVVFRHYEKENRTKASYSPLRESDWDIDNPLEYPCGYCGAERLEPCIGFNEICTYRVFSQGGKLT